MGNVRYVAIGGCAEQGGIGKGKMGGVRGDMFLEEDNARERVEDDVGCGGGSSEDV